MNEAKDASGTTEAEMSRMSLEEQYRIAGERYAELNDRFAEVQRGIFDGEWHDSSTSSEVVPGQGYVLGSGLRGETRENTYYFTMDRWYQPEDIQAVLKRTEASWAAKGWQVSIERRQGEEKIKRVTVTTDDGFWFAATDDVRDQLMLSASSPVYWGDRRPLSNAIADRRNAEDAAGAPWDTTDRDENGRAYRLPGVYRPFPAWDALPDDAH